MDKFSITALESFRLPTFEPVMLTRVLFDLGVVIKAPWTGSLLLLFVKLAFVFEVWGFNLVPRLDCSLHPENVLIVLKLRV